MAFEFEPTKARATVRSTALNNPAVPRADCTAIGQAKGGSGPDEPVAQISFPKGRFMSRQFDVIVEMDSAGFFVASVPSLPGCHTQARSLDVLMTRIREAIQLCLEVQGKVLEEPLAFVGIQRVSVAA